MSIPGFITLSQAPESSYSYKGHIRIHPASPAIRPAACFWYDYFYAPIACGWVAFNERYGIGGYGPSPCAAWQIPSDPVGCAALLRSRNAF